MLQEMSSLINQVSRGRWTPQLSEWCEGRGLWVQLGIGSLGRLHGGSGDVCISGCIEFIYNNIRLRSLVLRDFIR